MHLHQTSDCFLNEMFDYNRHCNHELIKLFLLYQDQVSEQSIKLLSHILNAHRIWNNRITQNNEHWEIWQIHSVPMMGDLDESNHSISKHMLLKHNSLKMIDFQMKDNNDYSCMIKDIMFHIINHSNYHRAQIATELRKQEIEPIQTDYIKYKLLI